ncbi:AMP-dependent synthetase, partial [Escherichia coli]
HQDDVAWLPFPGVRFQPEDDAFRVFSPLINADDGLLLDDVLQFIENGQFRLMGRRGRVVKIEEKRISLSEVEQRLLALDGICEVAALPVSRGGRQGVGVLLVLNDEARQRWRECGGKPQELTWRRSR